MTPTALFLVLGGLGIFMLGIALFIGQRTPPPLPLYDAYGRHVPIGHSREYIVEHRPTFEAQRMISTMAIVLLLLCGMVAFAVNNNQGEAEKVPTTYKTELSTSG